MATVQTPASKPAPATPKHEAYVESQLRRTLGRTRTVDVLGAAVGFLGVVLAFGLALIVLDAWLVLPSLVRQLAFGLFVLGALAYLAFVVARVIRQQVNPYYAAIRLEQLVPGAKNSLVNWLDLRDRPLPPAIRHALGARAARDLSAVNVDQAITARHLFWLGGVLLALVMMLGAVLSVVGPHRFLSLLQRTFAPFRETTLATRTSLDIVQPDGGNAVVPVGQSVAFAVRVGGRVPHPDQSDALKLQFRYSPTEPPQERRLVPGDTANEWTYRLPAVEVQAGFFYKITGGDAETPEFQVQARSGPVLTGFEVAYKHRPYLNRKDEQKSEPNLVGWRGTEVVLLARTNRVVKEGRLYIEGAKESTASTPVADNDQAMRFRFVLDKEGTYRIRFLSVEGEHSGDSVAYTIKVLPDEPPQVELTEPGEDRVLPANGTLKLKGKIKDDFGVADVQLRLKAKDGPDLQSKAYVPAGFRFPDGACPLEHDYEDFIALDKLTQANGKTHAVKPGDVIEYWLEATDNCDFPQGQVGKSKSFKITVTKPVTQAQQDKEREQAKQEQSKHEQQTAQKRKEEDEQRKKDAEAANADPQPRRPQTPEERADQLNKKQLDDFKNELDQKKAEAKPEPKPDPKGESKDKGQADRGSAENKPGETRPQPKPQDGGQGAGESKQPTNSGEKPGEKKDQGKSGTPPDSKSGQEKGQAHGTSAQQPPSPKDTGEAKGNNQTGTKPGDSKDAGKGGSQAGQQAGQGKSEGKEPGKEGKPGSAHAEGQKSPSAKDDRDAPTGEARGPQPPDSKGEKRDGRMGQPKGQEPNGQAKSPDGQPGGNQASQKPANQEQAKDSGTAKDEGNKEATTSAPKSGQRRPGNKDNSTMGDVADLAKEAQGRDPNKKADAGDQLRQIAQEAKDAQVREAAKEALKKFDGQAQGSGDSPSATPNTTQGNAGNNASENPGTGRPDGVSGSKTREPDQPGKTGGTGTPTDRTADEKKQGSGKNSKGSESGDKNTGREGVPGSEGTNPGDGSAKGNSPDNGGNGAAAGPAPEGSPADLRNKKRAAELQLEEVMKKVTPEMLKERNWTEEDLQRWHRAMKDTINRDYRKGMEQVAKPQVGGGGNVPGTGPRRVEGGPATTTANLQNAGKTVAPPEISNNFSELTQELSKLKKK